MTLHHLLAYVSPLKVFIGLLVLTTLFNVSLAQDTADQPTPQTEPAFSSPDLFPSWDSEIYRVQGVGGRNIDKQGDQDSLLLQVIPNIIDLLIKFVAPAVFLMMVFSGLRFIYSNDNEEDRTNAKKFFYYTVIGLLVVVLSYSIMRALYFIYIGD